LGADGKLSVDRVFKAILDSKPLIDKAFGATQSTIGDNLTLVGNALGHLLESSVTPLVRVALSRIFWARIWFKPLTVFDGAGLPEGLPGRQDAHRYR